VLNINAAEYFDLLRFGSWAINSTSKKAALRRYAK